MKSILILSLVIFTSSLQAYSVSQGSAWGRAGESFGQSFTERARAEQDFRDRQRYNDLLQEQIKLQERLKMQMEINQRSGGR